MEQEKPQVSETSSSQTKLDAPSSINELLSTPRLFLDYLSIAIGCLIAAAGLNLFLIPGELAAGGASGLATIIYHVGLSKDIIIPVGFQTIVMNALLMIPVFKSGGLRYASRSIFGIIMFALMIDITAPFLPSLVGNDLLLAGIWGGILTGVGLGLVFRVGANTGGTDILAQIIAKKSSLSVGTWLAIFDIMIVAASAPLFSVRTALVAAISMMITTFIIDKVVDGPQTERAAWIISNKADEISHAVLYDLGRGCTQLTGKGMWTGEKRPIVFVVLSKKEVGLLKAITAAIDPEAIMIISEINEAFGEGFKEMGVR
ncbi:MAG: YitT family protein [Coriobacteriia bacterium]|nr:YitT family protein [Coriobacteriia bacterium]